MMSSGACGARASAPSIDRKSTRLNSSHANISPLPLHAALPISNATTVSLGAGLRQPGVGGCFYAPATDRTVSIPAGTSVITRQFPVPTSPTNVYYDVIWGLWSAGFGTQYGLAQRDNAVWVTGPPATPTATK